MANRIGNLTAAEVISHVTFRLKDYTSDDIPPLGWLELINAKVTSIHELMGPKDRAIYKDSAVLDVIGNYQGMGYAVTEVDAANSFTHSSKILNLQANVYTSGVPTVQSLMNATVILMHDSGLVQIIHKTEIESVITITSGIQVVLKDSYGMNIGGMELQCMISCNGNNNLVHIGNMSCFKYIDQITVITDSGIDDECIDAKTFKNFLGMKKKNLPHTYRQSIIYAREGEYLHFAKGSDVSAYGTRTMYFTRNPYPVTTETDIVDIPVAHQDLLFKLLMIDGLHTIKVPIPQDLAGVKNDMAAMKQAKDKEIAMLIDNKPDN